jgi:rhodanese-related sulfurtransferase
MKHFLLIFAIVLAGCGVNEESSGPAPDSNETATAKPKLSSPPKHTKDSLELIQERITNKQAILIDVREQDEWDDGHLQSALLMPLSNLEDGEDKKDFAAEVAGQLSKDKIIYCHCAAGGRVMPASAILHKLGYDIRPLKAGYDALLKAGFQKAE